MIADNWYHEVSSCSQSHASKPSLAFLTSVYYDEIISCLYSGATVSLSLPTQQQVREWN